MKMLRVFCKELHIKQSGAKDKIVERVFVTMGHIGAGTDYPWDIGCREIARKYSARCYDAWLDENRDRGDWHKAPNAADYLCDEVSVASFTLNEFARLISLLKSDELLRSALIKSGLKRSRSQLDLKFPASTFALLRWNQFLTMQA